jgi:hypothetical protein
MISQALYVVAKLGVADLLADGPRSCAEVAQATEAHALSLYRVMRLLASVGVFTEDEDGRFGLTAVAESLRTDALGSMRAYVITRGEEWLWRPWGALLHGVKTGDVPFKQVFGVGFFDYLAQQPDAAAVFNRAMTGRSSQENSEIVSSYEFAGLGQIVDVGGGEGTLLASILEAYPVLQGIVFDQPQVIVHAKAQITARSLEDRCQCIAGDFFHSVPEGGDAYILSNVIHDWDEARAGAILQNCRQVMSPSARLLVLETIIPPGNAPSGAKLHDVQMLVLTGGRERTATEYQALLESAGFKLARIIPTPTQVSVIEGIPA